MQPARLEARYRAIIEHNKELLEDSRILDLASHDGRWSFAALKKGAAYVKGIEGNERLVRLARENMQHYGAPLEQYDFVCADLHEEIRNIEAKTFDGIFCLGFLAHTPHHMLLMNEFERLRPNFLVLDLRVLPTDRRIVVFKPQRTDLEFTAVGHKEEAWVGVMSQGLLADALKYAGFDLEFYDWSANPGPWQQGQEVRVTVTALRKE